MNQETQPETRAERRRRLSSGTRFHVVQALFQMEATGVSVEQTQRDYLGWRMGRISGAEDEGAPDVDEDLFNTIIDVAVDRQGRIDQMTDRALVARWPIARIDPVLRALFRAAGAELVGQLATPPRVIVTEYLRLAQSYYGQGREGKFVNAVLDFMAREARPDDF